jgi:hypothetical protein
MASLFTRSASMEQGATGGGGGGGGGPLPTTGLVARLRADQIPLADGDPVATWPGMVGGDDATQITSLNQPLLMASDINSEPSVSFFSTGIGFSSDYMSWDAVSGSTDIFSMLMVLRPSYLGDGYSGLMGTSGGGFNALIYKDSGSFVDGALMAAGAIITDPGGLTDGLPVAILLGFDRATLGNRYVYFNGGGPATFYDNSAIGAFTPGTILGVGYDPGGGNYFNGRIAEIAKWDHLLDSTERAEVFSYTLGRYGL